MSQKLSESLKTAIQEAFDKVDEDKLGSLDEAGVREVLQLIGQNPTQKEMKHSFQLLECDKIDRTNIVEFIEQYVPLKSQDKINDEIAEAFAKFETCEDFVISKADFRDILTKLGDEPLTESEADSIIDSLDQSTDKVNISDLSKLLSS